MTDRSPNESDDAAGRGADRDDSLQGDHGTDGATTARNDDAEPTSQYTTPYPEGWAPQPPAQHQHGWTTDSSNTHYPQPTGAGFEQFPPAYGSFGHTQPGQSGHTQPAQSAWDQQWDDRSHDPYSHTQPGGYGYTSDNGTYFESPAAASRGNRSGRRSAPLVAALLIGALVGGAAGAGWTAAFGPHTTTSTAAGRPGGNITVNDYNSASVVTAVAAKATDSVVTINATASSAAGTGSGVVLSSDGYIVTNTHVVTLDGDSANATISVTTSDGHIYPAKVVGTDPTVDLAVVKIDATGLTPITFADSSKINVGDTAIAIGAPLGLSNTVTDGIVSTLNRSISVASSAPGSGSGDSNSGGSDPFNFGGQSGTPTNTTVSLPVIQTDAAINPGNSGGALLDSKAKLIGINVAIASASNQSSSGSQSGSIGVGFAIPADLVKRVSDEIMKTGKATHGLLGANVTDATADQNAKQVGALIKSVTKGGAAANAGIQPGDVVTALGGIPIGSGTDLTAQVRYFAGGAKTSLTYVRGGESHTVDVTLGTYDSKS